MAVSVAFDGINRHWISREIHEGDDSPVHPDIFGFTNGVFAYMAFELSDEEIEHIVRERKVWVAQRTGTRPMLTTYVGSSKTIKSQCMDFGRLWRPLNKESTQ